MSSRRDIEILNGRLAAAQEAGPGDIIMDALDIFREAADLLEEKGKKDSARLLRRLAQVFGDDTNLSEVDIDALAAGASPVELVAPEALAKHVVQSIFALKTPSPDGSKRYQSGWDDGLEAAMDAARDAILNTFTGASGGL